MQTFNSLGSRKKNRGAVLILTMIFLVLMTMVAGTVMKISVQEFQMAGNAQFREEAFQRAQAIVSEISSDRGNFPIIGAIGHTICTAVDTDPACSEANFIADLDSATAPAGVELAYQVQRQGPLFVEGLPFRQSQSSVSSAPAFDTAIFEVSADVDGNAVRLGNAQVVQGIAIRVASSSQ